MGFFSSLFGNSKPNPRPDVGVAPQKTSPKITKSQKLLLLSFAEKYKSDGTNYPQYLASTYGIPFAKQEYQNLYKEGLIRESTNMESLIYLKNADLKTIATELGISSGGKKEDLCNRIIENSSEESLNKYKLDHYWVLTDEGKELIQNNPYITLYTEKHRYHLNDVGLDWETIEAGLANTPGSRYRDVVWGKLNQLTVETYAAALKSGNFHRYCEVLRTMALFVEEEGKYTIALDQYLRCIHYKINFKASFNAIRSFKLLKKTKEAVDLFMIDAEFLPFEIDDITRLIQECDLDQESFDSFMLNVFQKEKDTGIFNPQELTEFVDYGLRKDTAKQRKMFETNLKKHYKIK